MKKAALFTVLVAVAIGATLSAYSFARNNSTPDKPAIEQPMLPAADAKVCKSGGDCKCGGMGCGEDCRCGGDCGGGCKCGEGKCGKDCGSDCDRTGKCGKHGDGACGCGSNGKCGGHGQSGCGSKKTIRGCGGECGRGCCLR